MLVAFPIAFYTSTLAAFIVYGSTHDTFWLRLGQVVNWAGVVMAGVAAVPGLVDWASGIPRRSAAKKTGLLHMALNVGALAAFLVNAIIYQQYASNEMPDAGTGIVLSAIGVLLTLPSGFLGWSLVQDHHVGVNLERSGVTPNVSASEMHRSSDSDRAYLPGAMTPGGPGIPASGRVGPGPSTTTKP